MKTVLKRFSTLAAILALSLLAMMACTPEETPAPDVTAITASANGVENVRAGQSVILTKSITPKEATAEVTWEIVEGASAAAVAGDVLVVNASAETGAVIKVKAVSGEIESNVLTFKVGIPLEKIEIAPIGSLNVVKGNTVGIDVTLTPSDATNAACTWDFVEGREYADIKGNTLVVFANAATGAKITVKAVSGEIESAPLTFTVLATQEETNAERYFIDLSADSIRLDKKGNSNPTLFADIYNRNYDLVTDKELSYTVVEGAQYLSVSAKDGVCSFTALGHGVAKVEVRVVGTDVAETVTVDVIVPPEAIDLPEVFKDRPLYTYNFSYINHSTNEAETLPFVPTPRGELVCQDLVYSFEHESGDSGDAVAVYENGEITFKRTGKVTVTVSSSSGSRVEAAATYTFNINDGYNVYNYLELEALVEADFYNGQEINIVVLEKPDGSATGYTYGYDLVPPAALMANPTFGEMAKNARIQAVNKSLHINGNKHKIDASQMRVFTVAEYNAYAETHPDYANVPPTFSSLLSVEAWTNTGEDTDATKNASRTVYLHDFEVVGNCPVDYGVNSKTAEFSSESGGAFGVYAYGISIGNSDYTSHYYIDVANVTASAFQTGIRFSAVVGNGTASNLHAYNCYSTGIMVQSSIMTLQNLTFGPCGATGIEISPDYCEEAGLNDNEKQQITLVGKIDASTNLNDGNTMYFQKYTVAGVTIPYIIDGNCAMYTEDQLSHIRNENGQYCFVALIFNNIGKNLTNTSEVIYPAFQAGGIVDLASLPTDGTVDMTHEYIRMEIMVTLPTGTTTAGTALFYNMNYNG